MLPSDAAKILDLSPDATPEQLESRFNELRSKLEEKIGKAPTPGLKAKYRETLDEITIAFETLTLAADSSSLPVLQKQGTDDGGPRAAGGTATPPHEPRSQSPVPKPPARKSGREFALVAVIAIAVLGAGGWFIMKTRAENAEKARIAAEAARIAEETRLKRESETRAEEQRRNEINTSVRAQLAEIKVRWQSHEQEAQSADRRLSEIKGDIRSARELPAPKKASLEAQLAAHQNWTDWLQRTLRTHEARALMAKIDALLDAHDVDGANAATTELKESLTKLDREIQAQRSLTTVTAPLRIRSEPAGLDWRLDDSYGNVLEGKTPTELPAVPLGKATITFRRESWKDIVREITLTRNGTADALAEFVTGSVEISGNFTGGQAYLDGEPVGSLPLKKTNVRPGAIEVAVAGPGHRRQQFKLTVTPRETVTFQFAARKYSGPHRDRPYIVSSPRLELMPVPAGSVLLEDGIHHTPPLQVHLTEPFWMGKFEVTQAAYEAVMGHNPSSYRQAGANVPVENVSQEEALEFCRKLTAIERKAGRLPEGYVFNLPTDAQWQYSCLAGRTGKIGGNGKIADMAWYAGNSGSEFHPRPVGGKLANAWGLHDMHGNVTELCYDYPLPLPTPDGLKSAIDFTAIREKGYVILHGGNYGSQEWDCHVTKQGLCRPWDRTGTYGFRVALVPAYFVISP